MASRKQLQLFDDHHDMLADGVRMRAYAEAIRKTVQPGDRVVDLGAGLGILGFLALQAGAAHVYAVEKTDSIELARRLAEQNGLSDRVTFFHGSSTDFTLDEPADLLLSETLGSFGVEENTLAFTLDARRRLLSPQGRMLPRALRLWLAPICLEQARAKVEFWRSVQGLDFSPAIDELVSRMAPADIGVEHLMAAPQVFADVDLRQHEDLALRNTLLYPIQRPGTLHGVAGWFQVDLAPGILISTAPNAPSTHWRQAVFPLREPIEVAAGDYLEVTLAIGPAGPRSDDTVVELSCRCTQAVKDGWLAGPRRAVLVHDLERLGRRLKAVQDAFPDTTLHAAAIKAQPVGSILEFLVQQGAGLEAASLEEVALARAAGCPADRIVFDSPAKTELELAQSLAWGIRINADNPAELERIDKLLAQGPSDSVIGLRLNPALGAGSIATTSVADRRSRFGVTLDDPEEVQALYARYPWLTAVHLHVGSQGCTSAPTCCSAPSTGPTTGPTSSSCWAPRGSCARDRPAPGPWRGRSASAGTCWRGGWSCPSFRPATSWSCAPSAPTP